MGVVIDKLLAKPLLHNHTDKLDVAGDTMTGELDMQENAIIFKASDGSRYRLTIDTTGALVTTVIATEGLTGQPMGLLLTLTYAA